MKQCLLAQSWGNAYRHLQGLARDLEKSGAEPAEFESQMRGLAKSMCVILEEVTQPSAGSDGWSYKVPMALDKRYADGVYVYGEPSRRAAGYIMCNCGTCALREVGRAAWRAVDRMNATGLFAIFRGRGRDFVQEVLEVARQVDLEVNLSDEGEFIGRKGFAFGVVDRAAGHWRLVKSVVDPSGNRGIRVGLGTIFC